MFPTQIFWLLGTAGENRVLLRARMGIPSGLGLLLKPFSSLVLDMKMIHIFRQLWLCFTQGKARALLF